MICHALHETAFFDEQNNAKSRFEMKKMINNQHTKDYRNGELKR